MCTFHKCKLIDSNEMAAAASTHLAVLKLIKIALIAQCGIDLTLNPRTLRFNSFDFGIDGRHGCLVRVFRGTLDLQCSKTSLYI